MSQDVEVDHESRSSREGLVIGGEQAGGGLDGFSIIKAVGDSRLCPHHATQTRGLQYLTNHPTGDEV